MSTSCRRTAGVSRKFVTTARGTMAKKWIAGAIKRPGAFSAKAKKAGKSTSAYATQVTKKGSKASARTKRQANLARTLSKMRKKR